MNKKFLTVFAVFDDETQKKLQSIQNNIFSLGLKGTQTMDIPFHITLGSFPLSEQKNLEQKIRYVCKNYDSFSINLLRINNFDFICLPQFLIKLFF